MVDKSRAYILSARMPVSKQAQKVANDDTEKRERIAPQGYTSPGRIAPGGYSPFTSSFTNKSNSNCDIPKGRPTATAVKWADDHLKKKASRFERVVLAVRDAARRAEAKQLNPGKDAIYVTSVIREGWNLSPDQLSKGLRGLEEKRMIRVTERRKGRHARFVLRHSLDPDLKGKPWL